MPSWDVSYLSYHHSMHQCNFHMYLLYLLAYGQEPLCSKLPYNVGK
jgi:hypothetical protein